MTRKSSQFWVPSGVSGSFESFASPHFHSSHDDRRKVHNLDTRCASERKCRAVKVLRFSNFGRTSSPVSTSGFIGLFSRSFLKEKKFCMEAACQIDTINQSYLLGLICRILAWNFFSNFSMIRIEFSVKVFHGVLGTSEIFQIGMSFSVNQRCLGSLQTTSNFLTISCWSSLSFTRTSWESSWLTTWLIDSVSTWDCQVGCSMNSVHIWFKQFERSSYWARLTVQTNQMLIWSNDKLLDCLCHSYRRIQRKNFHASSWPEVLSTF